jgi:hypothetical protein
MNSDDAQMEVPVYAEKVLDLDAYHNVVVVVTM